MKFTGDINGYIELQGLEGLLAFQYLEIIIYSISSSKLSSFYM